METSISPLRIFHFQMENCAALEANASRFSDSLRSAANWAERIVSRMSSYPIPIPTARNGRLTTKGSRIP